MVNFGSKRLCSVETQLSRRGARVTKMIAIVYRKVATNKVQAPNKFGINQEVSDVLKEAGLVSKPDTS